MTHYGDIFKITHNDLRPGKGRVLISEPFLQDAYFHRSVILLIEHGAKGSMGFVLNRRINIPLNNFFPELSQQPSIYLHRGGPIASDQLFFVHSISPDIVPDATQIGDNLYFGGDFELVKNYLFAGNPAAGKIKFFLGYSGWQGNQLYDEIVQDSWLVSHSSCESILLAENDSFWKDMVKQLGSPYSAWANFPKSPDLN
ncbi:MAG: YqgE/AlgH family protein [Tannerella sp.]|nr:YqgE/AlgH family protein [Tannerella sp.]